KIVFKRLEKDVFHRIGDKGKSVSAHSRDSRHRSYHSSRKDTESCHQSSRSRETEFAFEKHHNKRASSRRMEALLESEGSAGGHWKSKPKNQKSSVEDDLSQPWAAANTECWAMPTWCHMFNSTLTGNARVWFDDLPLESIDSYNDLRKAFLENYLQQKKYIKEPVEIHNIKQRDGESTEEFVRRYKIECRDVKGAPECMKIAGFMHGITNPELIKRLHDKILNSVDEVIRQWKRSDKGSKKGEPSGKDKSLAILMVQPWQRVARKNITQTFSPESVISFPPLEEEDGMEGPMIIEAEMVTLSLQRNYREARGKENPGSSIHGPRNAKIPSDRRNGHITEQHDYSTRMYNGFRTRGAVARNQPSHRRKDSGGDPSRISRTICSDRLYLDRRRAEGAVRFAKAQP
ncbi:reverse transcriptase domain-containing protein, partial [Tanacetum coccineum]